MRTAMLVDRSGLGNVRVRLFGSLRSEDHQRAARTKMAESLSFCKICLGLASGHLVPGNIGALIIRIGCWGHCTIVIIRNPQIT